MGFNLRFRRVTVDKVLTKRILTALNPRRRAVSIIVVIIIIIVNFYL